MRWTAMVFVVAALLAAGPVAGAGMSLDQIARLQEVTEVAVHPHGDRVAYVRSVPRKIPDQEDGPAWAELHVADAGGESRGFVTGEVNVAQARWTPDGRSITFLAKRGDDATQRLYAIPADGGEARVLAALETDIDGYSLSPDGTRAALLAFEPVDEALEKERKQGFDQVIYEEDWQPRRIWIADLGGNDTEPRMLAPEGSVQEVHWSPAGDRLAVKVAPRELVDDTLIFARIRMLDLEGNELGRVDNPGKLGAMAWSPDGAHLAFIGTNLQNDPREGRLMVTGASGGEFADLLPGLAGHVWHLDWDGEGRIVHVTYQGTETHVGRIAPDGTGREVVIDDDRVWYGIDAAGDVLALVGSAASHPREAFRVPQAGAEPRRLTDSNPWLEDVELARQEVITYQARDGLEIQGILFYPLDYTEGQRYPLILAVHGGPESHYSNGWLTTYHLPAQHAAAEGYFMFYPNYRGSTGRGVEFTLTSQGRPAQEEFDDLVDGVDHLIAEGLVDADRVGITGGSYGGYASAWGATYYSEHFAAAVMNVGLSETIAMFGTSDIPWEFYHVHYRKWPWEDWDGFREASPVFHVRNAQTPILILHGDADPRVDPTQSKILYRYLVMQEDPPPVRLVLYPGEGHGNRRAASRFDYSLRLMRWMNHYLKGEGGDPPEHRLDYGLDADG